MRIVHISCVAPPEGGGIGVVASQEVLNLRKMGVDATLVAPQSKSVVPAKARTQSIVMDPRVIELSSIKPEDDKKERGEATIRLPAWRIGNVARLRGLMPIVKEADLVHLHYPFYFTAGLVARWRRQGFIKRLAITLHHDAVDVGWRGWVADQHRHWLQPKVLNSADRLLVSTLDYARHSSFAPWADDPRTRELPFGVDTEKFRPKGSVILSGMSQTNGVERSGTYIKPDSSIPSNSTQNDKRGAFGIPAGTRVIGTVSVMDRAHPFKGVDVLLKAAVMLPADVHVLLVGEGDRRAEYERQAQELGISDRTHFVGRLETSRLVEALQCMDIFVLPSTSRAEAFGLVVLEAMACGVPVVVSDLPGVRTVAQDAGLVTPVNDPAALAQNLRRLLQDAAGLSRMAAKARDRALTLSWEAHAQKLEKLYSEIVSPSPDLPLGGGGNICA